MAGTAHVSKGIRAMKHPNCPHLADEHTAECGGPSLELEKEDGYSPRGEPGAGWIRIGRYDSPRRRSLWSRVLPRPKDEDLQVPPPESIELCSGREGDDAYVKIGRDNPAFSELVDVLMYAEGNLDGSDEVAPEPLDWATIAYIWDRREQYKPSSGTYEGISQLISALARGDHLEAWRHGELDDLRADVERCIRESKPALPERSAILETPDGRYALGNAGVTATELTALRKVAEAVKTVLEVEGKASSFAELLTEEDLKTALRTVR